MSITYYHFTYPKTTMPLTYPCISLSSIRGVPCINSPVYKYLLQRDVATGRVAYYYGHSYLAVVQLTTRCLGCVLTYTSLPGTM